MSKASIYFDLEHPGNPNNCKQIKRRLDSVPGVLSVSISKEHDTVAVDYDTTGTGADKLRRELQNCGCAVRSEHIENHVM